MKDYVIALDQGTTSSRAVLVDKKGIIRGVAQEEYPQIYPREKWVEHDPLDIWNSQINMLRELLENKNVDLERVAALGITNQRETTLIWDRKTGEPVYNAIVWQCRRTAEFCGQLKKWGLEQKFQEKTGLKIDSYFSASKIRWILDQVGGVRERAERGELCFGTVDTWLIWKLTGGRIHVTDYTNASRTMLYNIHTLDWDEEILEILEIPRALLPEVKGCSEILGMTDREVVGAEIPIAGVAGDQQAALFGQMCLDEGCVKNTYGTGCFMLMNTGGKPVHSENGLLTTIAWGLNGKITYALEGSVFMAGATIQWLRDNLGIISSAPECNRLAELVEDNGGVYLVSSFQGMGSPYWDMNARAGIVGLTRGANKSHICRAALESVAYRSREILEVMEKDSGLKLQTLKVDGGASRSNIMMQFQSDILNAQVVRPASIETTALGAAYLAGLGAGFWESVEDIRHIWEVERRFEPTMDEKGRDKLYGGWKHAVDRCLNWDN
ncbi:MAG: glycerol kinase GlpK [Spirochaetales bacterium]|nr:glycerol kinase GlpK [Spirochaetales bacterium]